MNQYTKKLVEIIKASQFTPLRECSMCKAPIGYINIENEIYFDSNCDCTTFRSEPRHVNPDELDALTEQEGWRKIFKLEDQADDQQ